jgi:hypothetical protein
LHLLLHLPGLKTAFTGKRGRRAAVPSSNSTLRPPQCHLPAVRDSRNPHRVPVPAVFFHFKCPFVHLPFSQDSAPLSVVGNSRSDRPTLSLVAAATSPCSRNRPVARDDLLFWHNHAVHGREVVVRCAHLDRSLPSQGDHQRPPVTNPRKGRSVWVR